jgi:hypothetical protein
MKVIIRLSVRSEARALPILLRHSSGMVLPNRTYFLGEEAVRALRSAGIPFTEVVREAIVLGESPMAMKKVLPPGSR